MYLTFLTKPSVQQITMEDLLKNPYLTFDELPKIPQKKVTVEITEEYGRRLYNKNYRGIMVPGMDYVQEWDTSTMYHHYQIPKKSNPREKRPIEEPNPELRAAQTIYKTFIEDSLKVLNHKAAHAYTRGRSIVTNSKIHQKNNSKWFLHLDLSKFFNSINEEWLEKMLLEVYPYKFIPENHLKNIIHLAMLNNELPQGSILSPTLTNNVMVPIDYMITEKLHNYNKHHYVYTRYADDITISCKEKFDPKEIENIVKEIFEYWNAPFSLNESKTRFGSSAGKNYHLGIIINKDNQISVGHEKNNKFRAMLFNFCTVGEEWDRKDIYKMLGLISYYKSIEPDFIEKTIKKYNEKFNTDILAKAKYYLSK